MRKSVFIFAFLALFILGYTYKAMTNSTGAPQGHSGGPAAFGNTCTSCHFGASISSQTIDISTNIPATGFEENTEYTITVTANTNGGQGNKIGFESSVESASGHEGDIQPADARTQKTGLNYITHKSTSNTPTAGVNTWEYKWDSETAPDLTTIYVASNFANGNGTQTGDAIGTQTLVLHKNTIGLEEEKLVRLDISPNPASDFIDITLPERVTSDAKIRITDMSGRVVENYVLNGNMTANDKLRMDISNRTSGMYIVQIESRTGTVSGRFIVR